MLSNCRTKKTLVLVFVGAAMSVYFLGVFAIAQTSDKTEKILLTPNTMSQIVGGASCKYCDVIRGRWQGQGCSLASCSSSIPCSPSSATWENPSDVCKPSRSQEICKQTGYSGYREYYFDCTCTSNNCFPIPNGQHSGVSATCTDQTSTCS